MHKPTKTPFIKAFILLLSIINWSCSETPLSLASFTSPDGNIRVEFGLTEGQIPFYRALYRDSLVLDTSHLGILREDGDFYRGLHIVSLDDKGIIEDAYRLLQGKQREITYRANCYMARLQNGDGQLMDIEFRLSDDGFAFRYVFPADGTETDGPKKISEEMTTYNFPGNTRAWLQPMAKAKTGWEQTNPSYEEHYLTDIPPGTPSPIGEGWVYPALFKTGDTWSLVSEAGLERNYSGTRLRYQGEEGAYRVTFPQEEEVFPGGGLLPVSVQHTPWRIVAMGSLKTIVESTIGTDLAEPAVDMDTSFIQPGAASWSWAILKDESITYDIQKEFIDYAADMHWPYCLVDVNWDTTIGYEKITELAGYAGTKGVKLLLWYNSAGSWNTTPYHPRGKLLTAESRAEEFEKLREMGIAGIKVDFFGGDGQSMIAYYHDIFTDAARYQLLVNCHGTTLPRGWHRTYPHLMTMESVKGFEFITFDQENANLAPEHCALLPFTRNVFDPMDFTPMSLYKIPGIDRKTSNGFELALPVLFLSGIQHIAETPEGMAQVPGYVKEYLMALPTDWDSSHFIDGYPGKYAVFARKKSDDWYISAINGENTDRELLIDLSFIGKDSGYMITDGELNGSLVKTDIIPSDRVSIRIKPHGGLVMKF